MLVGVLTVSKKQNGRKGIAENPLSYTAKELQEATEKDEYRSNEYIISQPNHPGLSTHQQHSKLTELRPHRPQRLSNP